jgi:hypothetical protein
MKKKDKVPFIASKDNPLPDGLWTIKNKGMKNLHVYVKDQIMWLPVGIVGPIIAMLAASNIMCVGKHAFIRASEAIKINPSNKKIIEELAASKGVSI